MITINQSKVRRGHLLCSLGIVCVLIFSGSIFDQAAATNKQFNPIEFSKSVKIPTAVYTGTAKFSGWVLGGGDPPFDRALIKASGQVKLKVISFPWNKYHPSSPVNYPLYRAFLELDFLSGSITPTPSPNYCIESTNQNISVGGNILAEGSTGGAPVTSSILQMTWGRWYDPKTNATTSEGWDVGGWVSFTCGINTSNPPPSEQRSNIRYSVQYLPEVKLNLSKIPGSNWYSQECVPGGFCSKLTFSFKR